MKNRFVGWYGAAASILLLGSCSGVVQQNVEEWKVGTSSLMLDEWSQEEFDTFAANGIQLLEIYLGSQHGKSDEEVAEWVEMVKSRTDSAGIQVWSIHLPFSRSLDISATDAEARSITIEEHRRVMRLFQPLGIQTYVIHGSFEPVADDERDVRMNNAKASLRLLTDEVRDYGAQLAIEVLPRTCIGNTSGEIIDILDSVENGLKVTFDSNHMLQETPEEFVDRVGDAITHVHISDYDAVDEKHWVPKRGVIDWNRVIAELVDIGYDGPWMYEVVRRNTDDPAVTTKDLVENWAQLRNEYHEASR